MGSIRKIRNVGKSRAEWVKLIENFGGDDLEGYCSSNGVTVGVFKRWGWKLRKEESNKFIEVTDNFKTPSEIEFLRCIIKTSSNNEIEVTGLTIKELQELVRGV